MARYIDADALLAELQEKIDFESTMYTEEQNKYFNMGLKCALRDVKAQPTADVVPRAEVEKLELKFAGVMWSVDKWLDGDELAQDEVKRAITMREKALRIVEGLQAEVNRVCYNLQAVLEERAETKCEVASEIFDEIIKIINNEFRKCERDEVQIVLKISHAIFELKKKYTEWSTSE